MLIVVLRTDSAQLAALIAKLTALSPGMQSVGGTHDQRSVS